jgi:hypothetical protein
VRFCFAAHDGEAATPTLTEWARPATLLPASSQMSTRNWKCVWSSRGAGTGPFPRGVARFESVSGLFCQWRTNVSLVFSIRRTLLESSAAAPSNETRMAQAPVAERPLVLPPEIREPMSCHCYSNQHRRRALGAAPRRSLPLHSTRANGFSWFDAPRAGISVRTRSIMAPYGSGEPKQHVQGRRIPPVCR